MSDDLDDGGQSFNEPALQRSIFAAAHDAVFVMAGERFVDCNVRAEEMFGLPREQILGKTPWDLSPSVQPGGQDSTQAARSAVARAHAGTPHRFEWRHRGPGGGNLDAEVSLSAFRSAGREFLLAIVRDITDRKRSERALQDSEARYRSLVEAIPDVVFITDAAGRCLYANPSLESQTGYTGQDLPFEFSRNSFVDPRDRPSFDAFLRYFLHRDEIQAGPLEHRFVDKQGRSRWYSTIVSKTDFGGNRALQFIQRDITAHKEADEALRASEERFSRAFHTSPDAISISSLEDGVILEMNDSFERIYGYSRRELVGKSILDFGIWNDLADRDRALSALRRGEEVRDWEVKFRRKSGELGISELNIQMMEMDDEPRMLAVVRDITDRKRAENEKAAAFEEIARLKDQLERERDYLLEEVEVSRFGEIIGHSPAMIQVLARIEAVAGTGVSALITGESGTGKELVAHAIHLRSPRKSRAMVKVNCAAVPKDLFESEFFGHVKGSFTGAHQDRKGRFDLADGGTLFLDEVAEIPMELQGKLLRVLQEGEFERIGEASTRKVDVRIIAATNRDLKREMTAGRFRADLYYRLNVFPLEVPPLRERREDVLPLAFHFLERACRELDRGPFSLTRAQAEALQGYEWPGNIRELQNVIERAVILSRGRRLHLDLPAPIAAAEEEHTGGASGEAGAGFLSAKDFRGMERENILAALEHSGWKVSGSRGAAAHLGMKPSTLTYRMRVLGLRRPEAIRGDKAPPA